MNGSRIPSSRRAGHRAGTINEKLRDGNAAELGGSSEDFAQARKPRSEVPKLPRFGNTVGMSSGATPNHFAQVAPN